MRAQGVMLAAAYAVLLCFAASPVTSAAPQMVKSIEWKFHRSLYDYRMYGAVTLERISLPPHTVLVNITSTIQSSSDDCTVKHVKIYANQFGLPVVSRNKEAFPSHMYVSEAPVLNVSVASNNQTVVWSLEHLQAGELFIMGVMPPPDSRIKQQGLGEECDYYMTTQASTLYYVEESIPELQLNTSTLVPVSGKGRALISFRIPGDSVSYTVDIQGCNATCPLNISLWETANINRPGGSQGDCVWNNGSCKLEILSPHVNSLNYLSIDSSQDTKFNITIQIESKFCDMQHSINDLTTAALNITSQTCIFAGDLGRETPDMAEEGSNFYDHFVAWDEHFSPRPVVDVKVLDTTMVATRFTLRTSDTGTSLKVHLHVPIGKSSPLAHISLCLSPHRVLHPSQCQGGTTLNVTSHKEENKDYVIVPYPQSGHWFITLQSQCFQIDKNSSKEVPITCKQYPIVNVTVHLAPCVDGSCGGYGTCKLYFGADILYSACNCYSGWRGYGCNDGGDADSAAEERAAVFLLTLSNLGFIPGICLALYRRFYVEALVYSYNMFFSTFYHACDTSEIYQLCIMPYNALSFADFFASLLSFWVTLMAMARIPQGLRSFLHMLSALFISLGEVYDRHGLIEQLLPIVGGVAIVLVSWGVESYKRKSLFPSKPRLLKFILPGIILSGVGLVFNLALETQSSYKYFHSMWHLLESFCILFLLPPRRGKRDKSSRLSIQSGDIRHTLLEHDDLLDQNIHRVDAAGRDIENNPPSEPSSPPETPVTTREGGFKLLNRSRRNQNLVL